MGAMSDQRCANNPLNDDLLQKAIASIIATHETDLRLVFIRFRQSKSVPDIMHPHSVFAAFGRLFIS